MRTATGFLLALAIVCCITVNLCADPMDITFTTDGLIQTGDDYDDVWVYGDTTTVDMTGGEVCRLLAYDQSTINIGGGLVAYSLNYGQNTTINISDGVVHETVIDGTGNITGGVCWHIAVGGVLNISGGQITQWLGGTRGTKNIYGYGFAYDPFHSPNLTGFWQDGTLFGMDIRPGAYDGVVLHNVTPVTANAGGPYFLDQTPIMLGGSVVGDYSQAAWDLDTDGLFDDAFGLQPLISSTMLTSWGFSPGMTWDIGLQVTGLYGGVDTSMTQLTFVPVPGAVILGSIGLTFSGWLLRKRRGLQEHNFWR